jgi:RNA polymerase sigma-70 factor (ECF subfamily)
MDNGACSYRRFLEGDEEGLVEIIRDYKDGLIFYINSFVCNIHTAEDLAQETFVRLALKRPKDKQKGSFKTWLYTIGRNVAIDWLRKRREKVSLEEIKQIESDEMLLEASYIKEEERIAVHRAMSVLKEEYRQVLWMVYFEGFSNREAALVMGKSVHAVETLVYRARLALKDSLKKGGFVYENV